MCKPVLPFKFKTKLCKDFHINGVCTEGSDCEYVHTQTAQKSFNLTCKKIEETELSYKDIYGENHRQMEIRGELMQQNIKALTFLNFYRRPRLSVFKQMREEAVSRNKQQGTR